MFLTLELPTINIYLFLLSKCTTGIIEKEMKRESKLINLIIFIYYNKITEDLRKCTAINLIKNYNPVNYFDYFESSSVNDVFKCERGT